MLQGNGSTIAVLGPPGTEQGGLYCDMILRRLMFDALTHYSTSWWHVCSLCSVLTISPLTSTVAIGLCVQL